MGVARASSSSLHTVFFVIRMKLNLCLIVLCSYLTLSAARTVPDRNDWENDADRTSHDMFHYNANPYIPPPPLGPVEVPPPPPQAPPPPPEVPSPYAPPPVGLPPPPEVPSPYAPPPVG